MAECRSCVEYQPKGEGTGICLSLFRTGADCPWKRPGAKACAEYGAGGGTVTSRRFYAGMAAMYMAVVAVLAFFALHGVPVDGNFVAATGMAGAAGGSFLCMAADARAPGGG